MKIGHGMGAFRGMKGRTWLQLIKFQAVGLVNTLIDFGVFAILYSLGMGYALAQVISYSCGTLNSYLLNRRWTFAEDRRISRWAPMKFVALNGICLGLSVLLLHLFTVRMGFPVSFSKIGVTLLIMVINFAASKLLVFRSES
jgi:putative flippase GtrA